MIPSSGSDENEPKSGLQLDLHYKYKILCFERFKGKKSKILKKCEFPERIEVGEFFFPSVRVLDDSNDHFGKENNIVEVIPFSGSDENEPKLGLHLDLHNKYNFLSRTICRKKSENPQKMLIS